MFRLTPAAAQRSTFLDSPGGEQATMQALRRTAQLTQRGTRDLKVLASLYADPKTGYPPKYARDSIPFVPDYPNVGTDGVGAGKRDQTAPYDGDFSKVDFTPGDLLGCVSGELGLRKVFPTLVNPYPTPALAAAVISFQPLCATPYPCLPLTSSPLPFGVSLVPVI